MIGPLSLTSLLRSPELKFRILDDVQVVKYVHTSQYIGEFEKPILSSQILIGEFQLIFSYAVMLIWREFLEI